MPKLNVTPEVLEETLLGIFDEFHLRAEGRLAAGNLEQAWRRTGLRDSDLAQAVDLAVEGEIIVPEQHDGEMTLRLTALGAETMNSADGIRDMLRSLKAKRILNKAKKRIPEKEFDGTERRRA